MVREYAGLAFPAQGLGVIPCGGVGEVVEPNVGASILCVVVGLIMGGSGGGGTSSLAGSDAVQLSGAGGAGPANETLPCLLPRVCNSSGDRTRSPCGILRPSQIPLKSVSAMRPADNSHSM